MVEVLEIQLYHSLDFADQPLMESVVWVAYFDLILGLVLLGFVVGFYFQSRRAQKFAADKTDQFQLAMKGANDGIWDWNMVDDTVYLSPRWKDMLGYADEELESSRNIWRSLIHPEDILPAQLALKQYLSNKTPTYFCEYRLRHKDGTYRWILSRGIVQQNQQGQPVRMAGSHTDITERIRKAEELDLARTQAEDATRAKSEFLANMSHEIRTPLNGILGMAKILATTELTREQRECIDIISKSGESLLFVINDILDLSKIEAGKIQFEKINFHLGQHLADVMSTFRFAAEEKGVQMRVDVSSALPKFVVGDPGRLRQILTNLINNAIKFTYAGAVSVKAALSVSADDHVLVRFEVQDSGIGIPTEALIHMFQPFTQVDASTTRKFGGTGLGLFICKRLVELMGGKIGVESQVGVGSKFWFEVRLVSGAHQIEGKKFIDPGVYVATTRARILVAEDNPINQAVMTKLLLKMGHKVSTAENGIEVLNALEKGSFDLVLMDCQMPELDGYEATRRIRANPRAEVREVPIIAVTANALKGEFERCLEVGMNDFLTKPVEYQKLVERIEIWLPAPSKLRKSA